MHFNGKNIHFNEFRAVHRLNTIKIDVKRCRKFYLFTENTPS